MPKSEQNDIIQRLSDLIFSLSAKEKKELSAILELSTRRAGKGSHAIIFKELTKKNVSVTNLVPRYFSNAKSLYDSGRILALKIIEFLASKEVNGNLRELVIAKAIESQFFTLAGKVLREEFKRATDQLELHYLRRLYQLKRKCEKHSGITVKIGPETPVEEKVLFNLKLLSEAEYLYLRIKQQLHSAPSDRKTLFESLRGQIMQLDSSPSIGPARIATIKTVRTWFNLGYDYTSAARHHQQLVKIAGDNPGYFSQEEQARIIALNISYLIHKGHFSQAEKEIFSLGSMYGNDEFSDRDVLPTWIYLSLSFAVTTGKIGIGKRAFREYQTVDPYPRPDQKPMILYMAGLVKLYDEDWEGVINVLNTLSRTGKGINPQLLKVAKFSKAIALFELGYLDRALAELQKGKDQGFGEAYFIAVSQTLENAFSVPNDTSGHLLLTKVLASLNELIESGEMDAYTRFLDIRLWLKSKIQCVSMSSLIQEGKEGGLMTFKMSS